MVGSPSATQSALLGSPRYFVLSAMRSRLVKVLSTFLHMGAGAHESIVAECLGSHPPRQ